MGHRRTSSLEHLGEVPIKFAFDITIKCSRPPSCQRFGRSRLKSGPDQQRYTSYRAPSARMTACGTIAAIALLLSTRRFVVSAEGRFCIIATVFNDTASSMERRER
jgi:hypothetical protein